MKHLTFDEIKKGVNCQLSIVNCQKGFTLLEILIGFAIFGLISTLVAAIYLAQFRLFSNQNTLVDISSQNKLALDEITNQIRESQTVVASCCGGETTSESVLVLQLWPLDTSGEPYAPSGNAYDFVLYKQDSADNTKLVKRVVPDPASTRQVKTAILATTVSTLNFTYDNADPTLASQVTISLTNSQVSTSKTHTITQEASAVLRNK